MDPTIWGPHLWFFMHTLSLNYPDNPTIIDKKNNYDFFFSLTKIIPCIGCRNHYTEFFNKNPINNYLTTKTKLIEWVTKAHNNVNKLNNKPIWSIDKVVNHYKNIYMNKFYENINQENFKNQENFNNNLDGSTKMIIIFFSLILILSLIIYFVNKKK